MSPHDKMCDFRLIEVVGRNANILAGGVFGYLPVVGQHLTYDNLTYAVVAVVQRLSKEDGHWKSMTISMDVLCHRNDDLVLPEGSGG